MKQVHQVGPYESAAPAKGKPVQSGSLPPFSLQKPEREQVKHAAERAHRRDEGMNDATAPVAYASQPLAVPADGAASLKPDRSVAGTETAAQGPDPAELAGQAMLADDLALLGADPGIFEVMLPEGDTLGVSVEHRQQSVMFLLSASNDALSRKLKRQSVELQSQLAQRMETEVSLVVL